MCWTINTTTVCISLSLTLPLFLQPSSTFHQARALILRPAGGPFTMQPNVLIMCPAWSHCWWLADYHLIKRHGQAGERRTCHSLRSSSEHRNNTCWSLASCRMIPEGKWLLYQRKLAWKDLHSKIGTENIRDVTFYIYYMNVDLAWFISVYYPYNVLTWNMEKIPSWKWNGHHLNFEEILKLKIVILLK